MTVVPVGFCDNGEVIVDLWVLNLKGDCGQECHFPLLRGRSSVIVFRAGGFRATRYCRFFENSEISALLEFALEVGGICEYATYRCNSFVFLVVDMTGPASARISKK